MVLTLHFRCNRCMKLLQSPSEKAGETSTCPKCKNIFLIPVPTNFKERKFVRAIIGESELSIKPSESLTNPQGREFYKVVYTQADPIEFVLKRENVNPALDICEEGISFLIRADRLSTKLKPDRDIQLEIDFPILATPIYVRLKIKWAKSSLDKKTIRIGGMFLNRNESMQNIVQNLIEYVRMRPAKWDKS